jgi:DNA-binding response OmpR family regulator
MRVLLAEDDRNTLEGLRDILEREGYETVTAGDGVEALAAFEEHRPDFICLDIMMPGVDGYELCRRFRASDPRVPIIFISAKSEEIDKVVGLELGADDFIMKPFGVREVVARIRAITRRCMAEREPAEQPRSFRMGELEVFPAELRARRGGETIDLSLREVKILELLYRRKGEVVERDAFFDACWGLDYVPNSRTLDQHISQLRKRIERDPKSPEIIATVHGAGYRYDPS